MRVYLLRPTTEEGRPQIDFQHPDTPTDWSVLETSVETVNPVVHLFTDIPSEDWDCFMVGGTMNLFSKRAVKAMQPHIGDRFRFLPAAVNGAWFAFPVKSVSTDCFDVANAEVDRFRTPPHRIKRIHRYAFRPEVLAHIGIFAIPESRISLFATDEAKASLSGLRGLILKEIWCDASSDSKNPHQG